MIILLSAVMLTLPAAGAESICIVCDGEVLNTDVPPALIDGMIFVPVGNICRRLGAEVSWNAQSKMALITYGEDTLSIFAGSTYMERNGLPAHNDAAPFIENGRIMAPLDLLSESLGNKVYWDGGSNVYIYSAKRIYYTFGDTNSVTFSSKYDGTRDFAITFRPAGANGLPDFHRFYFVYNTESFPTYNFSGAYCFYESTTDWHSPFGIRAVDNIDGDYLTGSTHFTGGNHAYTNTSEGAKTAELKFIEFFADGRPVAGGSAYCDELKIHWVNSIAATNTKRADGSGRFVMEEDHVAVFDGREWKETVTLIPLEDILIDFVYGFQAEIKGLWDGTVTYIGEGKEETFDCTNASYPGFQNVSGIVCAKGSNCLLLTLDTGFGIGNRQYFNNSNGAFMTAYGKVYMNIVNGISIQGKKGESYQYRGSYRFYSA